MQMHVLAKSNNFFICNHLPIYEISLEILAPTLDLSPLFDWRHICDQLDYLEIIMFKQSDGMHTPQNHHL